LKTRKKGNDNRVEDYRKKENKIRKNLRMGVKKKLTGTERLLGEAQEQKKKKENRGARESSRQDGTDRSEPYLCPLQGKLAWKKKAV